MSLDKAKFGELFKQMLTPYEGLPVSVLANLKSLTHRRPSHKARGTVRFYRQWAAYKPQSGFNWKLTL